jgi:chemotaxis protein MotA
MRFSGSTVLGILFGVLLFGYAVVSSTDNYFMFLSLPSIALVLGGTIAASMIAFRSRYVLLSIKELFLNLISQRISPRTLSKDVERMVEWSRAMRGNGVMEVETSLSQEERRDPIISMGVELLVNGYGPKDIRQMLDDANESAFEREMVKANILQTMGTFSPAFGMVGTLIGLIIMLDNMQGDPTMLGKGLALALITTLYGVLLAQLLFKPAAAKIQQKLEIDRFRNILLTEGFVMLAEKKDTMTIIDRLNSYLSPVARYKLPAATDEEV